MLNVFGRVLSAGQLHQLREHKYRSQGVSVVEQYCLRFFWDWLVARLPLWLAPNLITLVGLCVSLGSSVVLLLLDPALEGRVSGEGGGVWFVCRMLVEGWRGEGGGVWFVCRITLLRGGEGEEVEGWSGGWWKGGGGEGCGLCVGLRS